MSQRKNNFKSHCLPFALRPSHSTTGSGGSTSSTRHLMFLLLGRSWRTSLVIPRLAFAESLTSMLPSRIRLTLSTGSWHCFSRRQKACCRGARAWEQFELCGCSQLTSCCDEPNVKPLLQCARDVVDKRVHDSHDLARISGFGVYLLQKFLPPPKLFLAVDRGLGYWFLRAFGSCHDDVSLPFCRGSLLSH